MNIYQALALSLVLTEAVELPVCLAMGFRGRELVIVLLANVVTNPPVVFLHHLFSSFTPLPEWSFTLALELGAFAAEAFIYLRATERKRPMLDSFIANAVSYSIGLAINAFIL